MSIFAEAFEASGALHSAFYGEAVTFAPRAEKPGDVNARTVVDSNRTAVTCTAIWDETPVDVYPHAREEKDASARKISDGTIVVTVAKTDLPWRPVQNDRVVRESTGEAFKVANPADEGLSDWILTLSGRR